VSVQEERELRERLGGLLDGIEPRPAPVGLAVRQGRGIRMRRWVTAAVGLAVLAGGAVALPVLLTGHKVAPPMARLRHFTVTVNPPGPDARPGLIASGRQDGHRWTVVISGHGKSMSVTAGGPGGAAVGMGGPLPAGPAPVNFETFGSGGPGGAMTFFGAVRDDVSLITVTLPGGKVVNLMPVRYDRERYIALVIPSDVPIVRATAYRSGVELAYSIPFDRTSLQNWWLPGQVGPARFTKMIASGVFAGHAWRYVAQFGPWGHCVKVPYGSMCLDGLRPAELNPPHLLNELICGGLYSPNATKFAPSGLGTARSDVRMVLITLSGGSTERYQAVDVRVARVFAYVIPPHQRIVSATAYNAAGQVLGTSSGLGC
jgi:hypothetical protein